MHLARKASKDCASVFINTQVLSRDIFTDILTQLGVDVVPLKRTDYFVPIDTEAVSEEDRKLAIDWATADRFDAIISTDGDADRPLMSDEHGNWLRGDVVGLLCAHTLGITQVVAPVNCISAIEASGRCSMVLRTCIGSPYVIAGMEQLDQKNGLFAGFEANGGFLLGSDVALDNAHLIALPTRDALLPILALLRLSLQSGKKFSGLVHALPHRYSESFRISDFAPSRSAALIAALKEDMSPAVKLLNPDAQSITSINTVDGLRTQFNDGNIVHVRPSGNAPEFRCISESTTAEKAKELCERCLQRVAALPLDF
jgi:phosphomannomutase